MPKRSRHGLTLDDPQLLRKAYKRITCILQVVEENIHKDPDMIPPFEGLLPELTSMVARIRSRNPPSAPAAM